MIPTTISHYQIMEKLGEGGMGVVYKARDLTLNRTVALKALPADRPISDDRKRRFLQEAQAASALNHPHIIGIHDFVSQDGRDFLVMEYVEGRTLDRLIAKHGLPLAEALEYAVQMADALSCAHAAGILHRDLKPANVIVSQSGQVKVLDFGLAKLTELPAADENESTRTIPAVKTEEGTVVGTASYMSPEQAEGKKVDGRSDIFSFGAVLYEMLTGRRAFQGNSRVSTLAAILREEPTPLSQLSGTIPHDVERVVMRCLRKDPSRRFQTSADLKVALAELREESQSGSLSAAPLVPPKRKAWWHLAVGGTLLAVALGFAGWWFLPQPGSSPVPQWHVRRMTDDAGFSFNGRLSPDGRLMIYLSNRAGKGALDLYIQQTAGGAAVRLTDGKVKVGDADFSPDGTQIVFQTIREDPAIYLIPAIGGEPRRLADRPQPYASSVAFSPDGKWVSSWEPEEAYSPRYLLIPVAGGQTKLLAPKLFTGGRPVWSPDSGGLFVPAAESIEKMFGVNGDVWYLPLEGEIQRTGVGPLLRAADLQPRWLVGFSGDRLYFSAWSKLNQDLWQVSLPVQTRQAVAGSLRAVTNGWTNQFVTSLSADGQRLIYSDRSNTRRSIWALRLDPESGKAAGKPERFTKGGRWEDSPAVSALEARLFFRRFEAGKLALWALDPISGKETMLGASERGMALPVVSRDGRWMAYIRGDAKGRTVQVLPTRGGVERRICSACGRATDWSPDGKKVLAHDLLGQAGKAGLIDIETGKAQVLLEHKQRIYYPQVSPDGRWLVFTLLSSGHRTYTAPYREEGQIPESQWNLILASEGRANFFRWSPGGGVLYFLRGEGAWIISIWAVRVDRGTGQRIGEPFLVYRPEDMTTTLLGDGGDVGLALTANRLLFGQQETHTNVWLADARQ